MPRSRDKEKTENIPIELKLVGNRIKELRKKSGYKNYEIFAFDNQISRSQMGKYEIGENMKLMNFFKVLKSLKVTPKEFFSEGFEELK